MTLYPRLITSITALQGRVGPYPSLRYSVSQVLHQSDEDVIALAPRPPVDIIQEDKNREVIGSLQQLAGYLSYSEATDPHRVLKHLRGIGEWIGNRLLTPRCLCCLGGALPRTIEILTDQQEIPWELTWVNNDFLSRQAVHARYPFVSRARHQTCKYSEPPRMALVIGRIAGLQLAQAEIDGIVSAYHSRFGSNPEIFSGEQVTKKLLLGLLQETTSTEQPYDVIHFIGHGDAQIDQVWLELPGSPFLDNDLPPRLRGNPVVFWNACHSAVSTEGKYRYQADVFDAFGSRLLAGGASHFIGSLFPVFDTTACGFALAFYREAFEGHPLGVAVFNAKATIDGKDPLVHTYALYGSPAVRLVRNG